MRLLVTGTRGWSQGHLDRLIMIRKALRLGTSSSSRGVNRRLGATVSSDINQLLLIGSRLGVVEIKDWHGCGVNLIMRRNRKSLLVLCLAVMYSSNTAALHG